MHGEIGVESAEGRGATFWFTTVQRKQLHADKNSTTSVPDVRTLFVRNGSGHHLVRTLGQLGCHCEEASNMADALGRLADIQDGRIPFRLVLIESRTENALDEAAVAAIEAHPELEGITVLFLTPLNYRPTDALLANRRTGFITKPIRRRLLARAIDQVLGSASSGPTLSGKEETEKVRRERST